LKVKDKIGSFAVKI